MSGRLLGRLATWILGRFRLRLPTDPVPSGWPNIVQQWVPLTHTLSDAERDRLLRLVQLFVHDVPFEGVDDLEVTEEMRVVIAATACLLILRFPYPKFTKLRRVVIYPGTFVPLHADMPHDGGVHAESQPAVGEARTDGIVVLSWQNVVSDVGLSADGRNVIVHEFAHILDAEDGVMDGIPILEGSSTIADWHALITNEFAREWNAVHEGTRPALDPYAATNRAEFFAVASEAFFEAPARLRKRVPPLYEQLRRYYRHDPAV